MDVAASCGCQSPLAARDDDGDPDPVAALPTTLEGGLPEA
jgi:hypothetical protein